MIRPLQRDAAVRGLEQPLIRRPKLLAKICRETSNVREERREQLVAGRRLRGLRETVARERERAGETELNRQAEAAARGLL